MSSWFPLFLKVPRLLTSGSLDYHCLFLLHSLFLFILFKEHLLGTYCVSGSGLHTYPHNAYLCGVHQKSFILLPLLANYMCELLISDYPFIYCKFSIFNPSTSQLILLYPATFTFLHCNTGQCIPLLTAFECLPMSEAPVVCRYGSMLYEL